MPSRNVLKISLENTYYHIYNRGVEKRTIFQDEQDYSVFLNYLKHALSEPPDKTKLPIITVHVQGTSFVRFIKPPKNLQGKVELVAYCLMPNHFHLLIKQVEKGAMETFMRSLLTRYSTFFNKKYERVGPLFQGRYKAVIINGDSYLLHLSRYIHLNPSEITKNLVGTYSSYAAYLGVKKIEWLSPKVILDFFDKKVGPEFVKVNNYKDFVENSKSNSPSILGDRILEDA